MFTLRPQFAAIVNAAARESTRYAINGVLVEECDDGRTSRAVATNGHILALMEAPNEASEFPPIFPADTPNGRNSAVIPVNTYTGAFKKAPRGSIAKIRPILANVLVQPSDQVTTIGSTDLESKTVDVCNNPELSFPPYQDIVPPGTPVFRYAVNPDYLVSMAQMAKGFTAHDHPFVVLEFYTQQRPMVLRTESDDNKFTGIIMGLNLNGPLANDERYIQWERKVKALDCAFSAVQAMHRHLNTLGPELPPDLQAIHEQCQHTLAVAGLTE